ncbi:MAG: hypothetical protein IT374_20795 [Polyangiaceae bacterium]|nr:hypothetical protein [Polyangiaceae bacterium]
MQRRHPPPLLFALSLPLAGLLTSGVARALDKQGSAHGGDVQGADEGINLSGAATLGVSLHNPSYGARPDNTGLALLRYAVHADLDLIGRRLSVPLDVNLFTDRKVKGARVLRPSEVDVISGVTTTWPLGPGALELGARGERDAPADRSGFSQSYADVRARYLYSLAALARKLGPALHGGDVSGWLTLGWFTYNPTYAARPDNTGLALLRYAAHVELSVLDDLVSVGVDTTFFTDRERHALRPTELDVTPELILHRAPFEVHVAYERDLPLDRPGLVQQFVYVLGVWSFDMTGPADAPLEHRGQVLSP